MENGHIKELPAPGHIVLKIGHNCSVNDLGTFGTRPSFIKRRQGSMLSEGGTSFGEENVDIFYV